MTLAADLMQLVAEIRAYYARTGRGMGSWIMGTREVALARRAVRLGLLRSVAGVEDSRTREYVPADAE